MSSITISALVLAVTPVGNQTIDIKYRKTSDPDIAGSYTDNGDVIVLPNGNLYTPLIISGLLSSTSYTVVATSICANSIFTKAFTTPIIPPSATVEVTETEHPYADIETDIIENGTVVDTIGVTNTRSYNPSVGVIFAIRSYTLFYPTGLNPKLTQVITKNGIQVSNTNTPAILGASLPWTDSVPAVSADIWLVTTNSSSDSYPNAFTVKADNGITITDVRDAPSFGTTGVPTGFNSISITPGDYLSLPYTTLTNGNIQVTVSGTIGSGNTICAYINDIETSPVPMTSGTTVYILTVATTETSPTAIFIVIKNY